MAGGITLINKMAASLKRQHEGKPAATEKSKKIALVDVSDTKLQEFVEWCNKNDFCLSPKVRVSREGSCAQYGMTAVEDIVEGYCLFQVPRSCLLAPVNSDISQLIEKDRSKLTATNQWIPLLVTLLHEQNNPSSKWQPYLDLVPDYESLDLPMFWEKSDIEKFLKGTGVDLAVERDLKMIQDDYHNLVLPFFERNAKREDTKDLEFFKKMVAFVMAYSFTEPLDKKRDLENGADESDDDDSDDEEQPMMSPPMMVPMADMLNHITKNNAKLTFGTEALKMVTTRAIKKGEEIYNTYGQVSNLHLMHMYGFAEPYPDNTNDVVEIPVKRMLEAAREQGDKGNSSEQTLVDQKVEFLMEQDIISDDDIFVLGKDGIITDDICVQTLKVLSMTSSEFKDYMEREGWSDAESDSSLTGEPKLDFDKISSLDTRWKTLLKRMGELHLDNYPTSLVEDEQKLKSVSTLGPREKYSLFTAHGQKKLIHLLQDACTVKVNKS